MSKYQNIMLATDLTQREDDPVVLKAKQIAKDTGAQLHVCHIVEHREYPYGKSFVSPDFKNFEEEIRKLAKEKLKKLCAKLGVSEKNQILESGSTKEKLIEIADKINADLIIIGNHTGRGKGFITLGSTADFVLRSSGRDVLAVHVTV